MDWYVLYVRPRSEKKVAEYCRQGRLPHYLPLRRETKIYQRRKVTVEKPLFPGYFFTAFDDEGRQGLQKTNHVLRILKPSSRRRLLRDLVQVRRALRIDPCLTAISAVRAGRLVRIVAGPFMGVEGRVQTLKGKTKVILNVDMIGRALVVEVDRDYLEVLE